jgi:hypothetical protein
MNSNKKKEILDSYSKKKHVSEHRIQYKQMYKRTEWPYGQMLLMSIVMGRGRPIYLLSKA